ncbi:helix-turn-helix domain-containing protein [Muribaculaceae bacterium Isolate-110 (HZI)]|nr:helix-turn-helix domain-containing protein [Muribaculaceae bacterium Isolate-110 (HZI)]
MFEKLVKNNSQEDIGNILGVSRQMVSKTLKVAKDALISVYIKRFKELINERTVWERQ